jgi:hypothetical protein
VPTCTKSAAGDSCGSGKITPTGLDQTLLDERKAFLRPDSLLAVLMLTDENDGSLLPAGRNWLPLAYAGGAMLRGWTGCAGVPDDFEPQTSADYAKLWADYKCISCFQKSPDGTTDSNCAAPWASPPLNADVDGTNERMLQHTRRYGYNFLWGRRRYVDAFSSPTVAGSDGKVASNPIYAGGYRTKDQVVLAGILGVPSKLLPTNADGTARDLTEADWDKIVSPDLTKRDLHMIEQIAPRAGVPKFVGDRTIDVVNGGDRDVADGNDLQYACIAPRTAVVANDPNAATGDCRASGSGAKNPLCGPDSAGRGTQPYFKAYPTLRELRVLHEAQSAGVPVFVSSICTDDDSSAVDGLVAKLQGALDPRCFKSDLAVDPATGAVSCLDFEVFPSDTPNGAATCEAMNGGKLGYCTPGAAPCHLAGSTPPPSGPDAFAAQMLVEIQSTGVDGTTKNEIVQAQASGGNVYVTGSDGKKRLVCEMLQLEGNPAVDGATQLACRTDPSFDIPVGGGWCYSTDDRIVGVQCKAAGAIGSIRFLGNMRPHQGSQVYTACTQ